MACSALLCKVLLFWPYISASAEGVKRIITDLISDFWPQFSNHSLAQFISVNPANPRQSHTASNGYKSVKHKQWTNISSTGNIHLLFWLLRHFLRTIFSFLTPFFALPRLPPTSSAISRLGPSSSPSILSVSLSQQLVQPQLLVPSPPSSRPLFRLMVPPDASGGWLSTRGFWDFSLWATVMKIASTWSLFP